MTTLMVMTLSSFKQQFHDKTHSEIKEGMASVVCYVQCVLMGKKETHLIDITVSITEILTV